MTCARGRPIKLTLGHGIVQIVEIWKLGIIWMSALVQKVGIQQGILLPGK